MSTRLPPEKENEMTKDEYEGLLDDLGSLSMHPELPGDLRDAIGELRQWISEQLGE